MPLTREIIKAALLQVRPGCKCALGHGPCGARLCQQPEGTYPEIGQQQVMRCGRAISSITRSRRVCHLQRITKGERSATAEEGKEGKPSLSAYTNAIGVKNIKSPRSLQPAAHPPAAVVSPSLLLCAASHESLESFSFSPRTPPFAVKLSAAAPRDPPRSRRPLSRTWGLTFRRNPTAMVLALHVPCHLREMSA